MIITFLSTVLSASLSVVFVFANAGAAAEKPGAPAWDAAAHTTFGAALVPRYEITFDELLGAALDELTDETGFDIPGVAAGLPDFFYYQRWMAKLFPGFFYGLRDAWLVGQEIPAVIIGMPEKMHFKTEPTDWNPDGYRVLLEMTYADGSLATCNTFSMYNTATGTTGFAMQKYLYLPNQLTLKAEILPADEEMKLGLIGALNREAAASGISYTQSDDGTRLYIVW